MVYEPKNKATGDHNYPKLELVRLTIPRRVYTQAHMDVTAESVAAVYDQRQKAVGLRMVYEPKYLRFFQARFEAALSRNVMSEVTINAAGLRIVKLLVGRPPQTIFDLIRAAGVTRTAVAEQLNELAAAGFVEQHTQRLPGRGRPRHLYKATDAAMLLLFPGNQRLVVPAIWRAIFEIGGEDMIGKVVKRVGRALAERYSSRITAKRPQERLRQLIALLAAEGGLIDAVENAKGRLVLCKRSCPFISMVDERRSVCHVDREMIGAVVGRPVRQTACRHEGDPCLRVQDRRRVVMGVCENLSLQPENSPQSDYLLPLAQPKL